MKVEAEESKGADVHDEQADAPLHVHHETLARYLELRQERKSTLYTVPLAVYALVVVLGVVQHRAAPWRAFPVERAIIDGIVNPESSGVINGDMTIQFGDIGAAGDVFDWLRDTLIPAVAATTDYNGRSIDYAIGDDHAASKERLRNKGCGRSGLCRSGRVLGYNRLFYGVHVTQTRFNRTACLARGMTGYINNCYNNQGADSKWRSGPWLGGKVGSLTASEKSVNSQIPDDDDGQGGGSGSKSSDDFGGASGGSGSSINVSTSGLSGPSGNSSTTGARRLDGSDEESTINSYSVQTLFGNHSMLVDQYGGFWLPEFLTESDNIALVDVFEDASWIDLTTKKVSITFMTINNEYDVLARTKLDVKFERGGRVTTGYEVSSTVLKPYKKFTLEGGHAADAHELKRFESNGFWNQIALQVLIVVGAVLDLNVVGPEPYHVLDAAFLACIWYQEDVWGNINTQSDKIISDLAKFNVTTAKPEDFVPYFELFEELMIGPVADYRQASLYVILALMFYTMKCFRHHPQFSVLLKTVVNSVQNGFFFFVLFAMNFALFVFLSIVLFGHQVLPSSLMPVARAPL